MFGFFKKIAGGGDASSEEREYDKQVQKLANMRKNLDALTNIDHLMQDPELDDEDLDAVASSSAGKRSGGGGGGGSGGGASRTAIVDDDMDIQLTAEDMNDPELLGQLAELQQDLSGDEAEEEDQGPRPVAVPTQKPTKALPPKPTPSTKKPTSSLEQESFDDEDESTSNNNNSAAKKKSDDDEILDNKKRVRELKGLITSTKAKALAAKKAGDMDGAVNSMRMVKIYQTELDNLTEMLQAIGEDVDDADDADAEEEQQQQKPPSRPSAATTKTNATATATATNSASIAAAAAAIATAKKAGSAKGAAEETTATKPPARPSSAETKKATTAPAPVKEEEPEEEEEAEEGDDMDAATQKKIAELTARVNDTVKQALAAKRDGNVEEALRLIRMKKQLEADVEALKSGEKTVDDLNDNNEEDEKPAAMNKTAAAAAAAAKNNNSKPQQQGPVIHGRIISDAILSHIGENELEVTILRCVNPAGQNQPVDSFVTLEMKYPSDAPKKTSTSTAKNSSSPEYNFVTKIPMDRRKNKTSFEKFLQRKTLSFELFKVKGIFGTGRESIGKAEVNAADLIEHSSIHEWVQMNSLGAQLEIKVALRFPWKYKRQSDVPPAPAPAAAPVIVQPQPAQAAAAATKRRSSTNAPPETPSPTAAAAQAKKSSPVAQQQQQQPTPAPKATPAAAPAPAEKSSNNDDDPSAEFQDVVSGMLLGNEIEAMEAQIASYEKMGKPAPDSLVLRKEAAEERINELMIEIQVQPDKYLARLKQRVNDDKLKALAAKKAGDTQTALALMKKIKVMQEEVQGMEG